MPQRRRQATLLEQPQRPHLRYVDHDRIARITLAEERHHAVGAGRGALHDAGVTADVKRAISHGDDPTKVV